ncbi:hypothetical protein JKG47_02885 [Acidithiobacillus sp. MC6.1]|nr:hypothetical protein [Acidithiobacillus sp. MC6.1]
MWNIIATILVLAIIAIGLVEVYQQYGSASSQQSAQDLTQEVAEAIANVNNAYAADPNFATFTSSTPYTIGAAPSDWQGTSGTFILPEGGTAVFAAASVDGGTDNGFSLTLKKLSPQECGALAGFYTQQMSTVTVGSGTATNPAFNGGTSTWPTNLVSDCVVGAGNTVVYTVAGQ